MVNMTTGVSLGVLELDGQPLSLDQINLVANGSMGAAIAPAARPRIAASQAVVERIVTSNETAYGINTGFGKLSDVRISTGDLQQLQRNLVRSHACGVGDPLEEAEVRAMLLLRANVLAKGLSGVRYELIELLIGLLNRRVHPVIPARGSVGASGDLAPLAHLALVLIGEGEVFYQGARMPTAPALGKAGLAPLVLEAKEGLALLNGTQAMAAVGGLAVLRALRLNRLFDLAGAMALEALRGTPVAFDERIHQARPHPGQIQAAAHLRALLRDSEIRESHLLNDPRVQDAYCLRCMPQVHGAARGALQHVREVIEIETGSATDNPLIFSGDVLSGGNFHGAPLGMALDYAAIAVTDLMSISERRIDRLINPDANEGLPPFLSHGGRSLFRTYDCSRHRGCVVKRSQGACAPRERRQPAHFGGQGRSCLHGHDRCAQAEADRRQCGEGTGHRADDRGARTRIPPAAQGRDGDRASVAIRAYAGSRVGGR